MFAMFQVCSFQTRHESNWKRSAGSEVGFCVVAQKEQVSLSLAKCDKETDVSEVPAACIIRTSIALMLDVNFYQTKPRNGPEDGHIRTHRRCENLRTHYFEVLQYLGDPAFFCSFRVNSWLRFQPALISSVCFFIWKSAQRLPRCVAVDTAHVCRQGTSRTESLRIASHSADGTSYCLRWNSL